MKVLLHRGEFFDGGADASVADVVTALENQRDWLHRCSAEDIIEFCDALAEHWRASPAAGLGVGAPLRHLARFLSAAQTRPMMTFALRGNYAALDRFVEFNQPQRRYHCQPRGLVLHWLSGNVPLLGFYALFQALLTKNVSVVKPARSAYQGLISLLATLPEVRTERVAGGEVLKTIAVLLLDHDEVERQQALSEAADVRVLWGGSEAVAAMAKLPKRFWCEDIVYGPKYSYGVIDRESLAHSRAIAERLAFDAATFDQYACSSPHTVFVEESDGVSAEDVAAELARALDAVTKKFLPPEEADPAKKIEILTVRAKYAMLGKSFASAGTEWTVVCSREKNLAEPCGSRVIFVRPVANLGELAEFRGRWLQTLGAAIASPDREALLDELTRHGIDRVVRFGEMSLYESPWDGMFAIDRMVRWVSLSSGISAYG